jgi:uncharacterized protein (DUF736 family)
MADFEMKDDSMNLWKNAYKNEGDKKPDYTGKAKVNGVQLDASMWINTNKEGKRYLSGKFQTPKSKEEVLF